MYVMISLQIFNVKELLLLKHKLMFKNEADVEVKRKKSCSS